MTSGFKFLAMAVLATAMVLFSGVDARAFNVGDKVEIDYGGSWYPGQVKEIKDGQFFVGYDGYDTSWDEWVESARLRVPETAAENEVVAEEETAAPEAEVVEDAVAADETEVAAPAEAEEAGLPEITIRKGGMIWATISPDGTIRVNGSIAGEVDENGGVRVSGMISGEIGSDGTIRKNGSIAGEISPDGTLRANGSIVGGVESDGTLRSNGSIWGEADASLDTARNRNAVTAVLVFFAGSDFGF